jgi:hypothetical protein
METQHGGRIPLKYESQEYFETYFPRRRTCYWVCTTPSNVGRYPYATNLHLRVKCQMTKSLSISSQVLVRFFRACGSEPQTFKRLIHSRDTLAVP